jgi:hypothetical protein
LRLQVAWDILSIRWFGYRMVLDVVYGVVSVELCDL